MIYPPDKPWGGPHEAAYLVERYGLSETAIDLRRRCVESPLFLASEILSCEWQANLLDRPSSAHREAERAMLEQVNTLLVDARSTAKTTVLIEVGTVSQFLRFPNDAQLISHSSAPNSRGLSESVRRHLTRNERFRALFPDYALVGETNVNAWSVPCRRRGGVQESVETATPGAQTAGRHFDVVRMSDWMNENTTPLYGLASFETMKSLVDLTSQIQGLLNGKELNPRAHWTLDTNRWADGDQAGTIIRRDEGFDTVRKIVRGVKKAADGSWIPTWPEVKTPEMMAEIHDAPTMTAAMWAANYCADPLPDGGMSFKRDKFIEYREMPKRLAERLGLLVAVTVDPAYTDTTRKKRRSDRSGIVVSGISPDTGDLYILVARAGYFTPNQLSDALFALSNEWKPQFVGVEKAPGSLSITTTIRNRMARTGERMPLIDLETGGHDKNVRIAPLHAHVEGQGLYLRLPEHAELMEELLRFGVAEHDDLADALAYRMFSAHLPHGIKKQERPVLTFVPPEPPETAESIRKWVKERTRARKAPAWGRRTA